MLLAAVLAAAYGLTDEIHQIFVPLRSVELADWMADAVGGLAGAIAARASRRAAFSSCPKRVTADTRAPS